MLTFDSATGNIIGGEVLIHEFIRNQKISCNFDKNEKRLPLIQIIPFIPPVNFENIYGNLYDPDQAAVDYKNLCAILFGRMSLVPYLQKEIPTLVKQTGRQDMNKLIFLTKCFVNYAIINIQENNIPLATALNNFETKKQPAIEAVRKIYKMNKGFFENNNDGKAILDLFNNLKHSLLLKQTFLNIVKENDLKYFARYHFWQLFFGFMSIGFVGLGTLWYKKYGIPESIKNLFYKKR